MKKNEWMFDSAASQKEYENYRKQGYSKASAISLTIGEDKEEEEKPPVTKEVICSSGRRYF